MWPTPQARPVARSKWLLCGRHRRPVARSTWLLSLWPTHRRPWKAANGTAKVVGPDGQGGYPFDDCPAVHVLRNGSIVTWAQPNLPGQLKPLYIAQRWGAPFLAVQPTIAFPPALVARAKAMGEVIKLDDPTLWVRGFAANDTLATYLSSGYC